jgi:hypothetical protein
LLPVLRYWCVCGEEYLEAVRKKRVSTSSRFAELTCYVSGVSIATIVLYDPGGSVRTNGIAATERAQERSEGAPDTQP